MLNNKYTKYLNSKSNSGNICIKIRLSDENSINRRPQSIINKLGNNKILEGTLKNTVIVETTGVIRETVKEKGFLGIIKLENAGDNVKVLTYTDIEEILKEVPFSPNFEIENSNLEKSTYISLINVLTWIEVELLSEI